MKYELAISGMTCLNCARTVERALADTQGVQHATVSFPARHATVDATPEVGADTLREAVARAGYSATVVSGTPSHRESASVKHAGGAPSALRPSETTNRPDVDFDLLVVGSGSAGVAAAIRASELGATAAVVEQADVIGGTCVNVGCIPSKNLIEAAHHYHTARTGSLGLAPCELQLDWDQVLAQKRHLVETLRREKYTDVLQAYEGITLLHGHAELRPEKRDDAVLVRVGERAVHARKVILATGTRPAMPPIPGLADVGALDSTSVMELVRLPTSMLVIGAGSVGLELGQAFQRFGVRVIVVEALDRILPSESPEVSAVLERALANEGMEFHTATRVTRVERTATGLRLEVDQRSLVGHLEAQQLLIATGRVPNVERLGVEEANVRIDANGYITTDEFMRTSNPNIFAAGDVTGGPAYVYVAALEGGIAAQAALADIVKAEPLAVDLGAVPRVTFTDPQVAAVGYTEAEARAAGFVVEATTLPVEYLPRAAVSYRRQGTITLIAESGTDRLLGAQVVSPNAGDIIGEAVLAVRFGLTTRDLVSTLHAYLTWGEGLKLAAQTFTKDVAKLSCCA